MPISYITRNHTRDNMEAEKQKPAAAIAESNEARLSLTVCLFVCLFGRSVGRSVGRLLEFIDLID